MVHLFCNTEFEIQDTMIHKYIYKGFIYLNESSANHKVRKNAVMDPKEQNKKGLHSITSHMVNGAYIYQNIVSLAS